MFCKKCGISIEPDAKFCSVCGRPIAELVPENAPLIEVCSVKKNAYTKSDL